ncbi:MAG: RagB/SusD family nutrient uptake outer membrane protein [Chitinophagaceae bacterium]|nr:MAG: RagB/SusD family nutrient uptake outer membrane protein [Chitinophagaceae bacterium]
MKKLSYLIFLPVLVVSMVSCKKLIEIEETDFIDESIALKTVANTESALLGAYNQFNPEFDIRLSSVFSDELKPGEFYNAASTHEWQYTSNDIGIRDTYTAITNFYYVIDRVNRVLRRLPLADSMSVSDGALRARVKGECLFLRALCHFGIFQWYCDNYSADGVAMPYMEEPSLVPPARIGMTPYFEKLENDLREAKLLIPAAQPDIYRASRLSVVGLQARVALYKRDWPSAITFSTEFINAVPLADATAFKNIWTDAGSAELGLKIRRTTANGRMGSFYRGLFTRPSASAPLVAPGSIPWTPSDKLFNSYDQTNDVRFSSYVIDEPLLQNIPGKPSKLVAKYAGTGYATTAENVNDIKFFRTGEMYLIRAEARAETGAFTGAASAESDLNDLRAARITGYTPVILGSTQGAISEIMNERFKELAYEGHRFFDLKRRGLPIERLASDAPNEGARTLPANNFRFILPIPQVQMQANPNMVQNPGYVD